MIEIITFIKLRRVGSSNGGEKLDIINKARLKTRFIDTKPYWEEIFGQGVKVIAKQRQLSDVISSIDLLKLEDVKPSLLLNNLEFQERSLMEFHSCNKANKQLCTNAALLYFPSHMIKNSTQFGAFYLRRKSKQLQYYILRQKGRNRRPLVPNNLSMTWVRTQK